MTREERIDDMLARYGECCKRATAARILSRSAPTINQMIRDGRLATCCAGTMVDVRSIAEYLTTPAQIEETARVERIRLRNGSNWAV